MPLDPRLIELMLRWEELRDQGRTPTPEELCRDHPELLESFRQQIGNLDRIDDLLGSSRLPPPPAASALAEDALDWPSTTARTVPHPAPAPGGPRPNPAPSTLGRYQPLNLHARGGLGEVFLARDLELNREVALKQMQEHVAGDDNLRRRFLLEAEVTGRLEHPGIVPVYGLGLDPMGRPYYAMRFIKGQSLHEAIRAFHEADTSGRDPGERTLALRQLLGRFVATCNALGYAHARGIVHRDIKPGNIMLGAYGETLVVDWGLARAVQRGDEDRATGEETLTPSEDNRPDATRGVVGTPAFMSPEQAAGRQSLIGPASDVYSLGATLYVLLTGKAPLEKAPLDEMLEKVQRGEFPSPRTRKKDVPSALEAVCLKAMALRREDRYPTATALARDVEAWLADEPVSAWKEPFSHRAWRFVKRRRTPVVASFTVLVVLVVSGALLYLAHQREREALRSASLAETTADLERSRRGEAEARSSAAEARVELEKTRVDAARTAAEVSERLERQQHYVVNVNLAWRNWEDGKLTTARKYLRDLLPPPDKDDLRGFEWYALWRACHPDQLVLHGHADWVSSLAFAPDGKTLASGSKDGTATLWDTATGRPRHVLVPDPADTSATLGVLWAIGGGMIRVDRVNPQGPANLDGRLARGDILLGISGPDDRLIPASGLDAAGLHRLEQGPPGSKVVVVVSTTTGQTRRYTLARRRQRFRIEKVTLPLDEPAVHVAYVSRGKTLATTSGRMLRLWDSGTGAPGIQYQAEATITSLAASSDGRRLGLGLVTGVVELWDVETGKCEGRLVQQPQVGAPPEDRARGGLRVHALDFSPDGTRLLTSAGTFLTLWDAVRQVEIDSTFDLDKKVWTLSFTSDGQTAVLGRNAHRDNVSLWNVPSSRVRGHLQGHTDWVRCVARASAEPVVLTGSSDQVARLWNVRTGRTLNVLRGHNSVVNAVALSADGRLAATGGGDQTIRIHRLEGTTGAGVLPVRSRSSVNQLAFTPDGKELFVSTSLHHEQGKAHLECWDLPGRRFRGLVQGRPLWVGGLAFSPDGKLLAATHGAEPSSPIPGECRIYDARSGKVLHRLAHEVSLSSCGFSADGKILVTGGGDMSNGDRPGEVHLWDVATGQRIRSLPGHPGTCGAHFGSDGKTLFTAGALMPRGDGTGKVRLWDPATGKLRQEVGKALDRVLAVDLSPDGKYLITCVGDPTRANQLGEVALWEVGSDKQVATLAGHGAIVDAVAFAPDGKSVVAGSWDKRFRIYEVPTGKLLWTSPEQPGWVTTLSFSGDGKRLAVGIGPVLHLGSRQASLARLFDLNDRKVSASFPVSAGSGVHVQLSPDGNTLATGTSAGDLLLWDVATQQRRLTLADGKDAAADRGHSRPLTCLAVSPDGKTLATGSWDSRVKLWDLLPREDGGPVACLRLTLNADASVSSLAFSPDGATLAWGTGGIQLAREPGSLTLFDLFTEKVRATIPARPAGITGVAFSPDGTTLAAATDHFAATRANSEVWLIDVATGKRREVVHTAPFVTSCLAFAPDGKKIAFEWGNASIALLDLATRETRSLRGHVRTIEHVLFTPDGKTLISASSDSTVKLWQVATGRELFSMPHEHWVQALALSRDGKMLATGSQDAGGRQGVVHLFDAGPVSRHLDIWYDPAEAGYARRRTRYDEKDQISEHAYYDEQGKPARGPDGTHATTFAYDLEGRAIEQAYRDEKGKLTVNTFGFARRMGRYDGAGKLIDVIEFDVEGNQLTNVVEIERVVPGGRGETLGLKPGDVLVRYAGKPIQTQSGFVLAKQREKPDGPTQELVIRRKGKEIRLETPSGLLGVQLRTRREVRK